MISAKSMRLRLAALGLLLSLCWSASHSQSVDPSKINEEMTKQEAIYRSDTTEGYIVNRGLSHYTRALPPAFDDSLADLGPDDRWLDVGAGEAQAILDYYAPEYDLKRSDARKRSGKKAKAVAMSIEDRRTPLWRYTAHRLGDDRIRYLANKRLRQYSTEELGRFKVITDVAGGFSYTELLSQFMEKVLSLLEVNGSFYTMLQDVHSEVGTNKPYYQGSPFLTEIENSDGSELKVCSWLKSISCVNVTCEFKNRWYPPLEAFQVQKVCDNVAVPALTPVHYEAGTPPERRFRLGNRTVKQEFPERDKAMTEARP
jgi:hypothetical protein